MARVQSLSPLNVPSTAVFQPRCSAITTATTAVAVVASTHRPVVMQSFANIESLIGLSSDRSADRRAFHDLSLFQSPNNHAQSSSIDVDSFSSQVRSASSAQQSNDANKIDFGTSPNHSVNNSNGLNTDDEFSRAGLESFGRIEGLLVATDDHRQHLDGGGRAGYSPISTVTDLFVRVVTCSYDFAEMWATDEKRVQREDFEKYCSVYVRPSSMSE
uniref:Uncharacterized protein n=1 Tax=Plectus sambesii TaxID=2011161 RepID=A0A914ULL0_9BILA